MAKVSADEVSQILFVEDSESDFELMSRALFNAGIQFESQRIVTAGELSALLRTKAWDIVISDYSVPGFGGLEALAIVRGSRQDIPFVLVSGSVGEERVAEAIRLGARDYLIKDRLTRLPVVVRREIADSRDRKRRISAEHEAKHHRENLERLKRFFPSGVAERIASNSQANPFQWHRKDVTVLFVDLHGFTSFVELSEPEAVVQLLTEYYSRVAAAALEFHGTIGHVAGDGVMIFFNDPLDIPNPQEMAIRTGLRLKEELNILQKKWSEMSYSIDFGAGIASGFATVGGIGVEGCWDYSVIGTVTNLAQRLCSIATKGQILIPHRMVKAVSSIVDVTALGSQHLKGIHDPMVVYDVVGPKTKAVANG
jgi:adenylate cyclase